jgi:hypothetical protein
MHDDDGEILLLDGYDELHCVGFMEVFLVILRFMILQAMGYVAKSRALSFSLVSVCLVCLSLSLPQVYSGYIAP